MCCLSSPCTCTSTRTCMSATSMLHACVPYAARTSYVSTHESHRAPGHDKSDNATTGWPMRQKPTATTPTHGLCDIPYWTETGTCTYECARTDPSHEHAYAHDIPRAAAYHAYTHAYAIPSAYYLCSHANSRAHTPAVMGDMGMHGQPSCMPVTPTAPCSLVHMYTCSPCTS